MKVLGVVITKYHWFLMEKILNQLDYTTCDIIFFDNALNNSKNYEKVNFYNFNEIENKNFLQKLQLKSKINFYLNDLLIKKYDKLLIANDLDLRSQIIINILNHNEIYLYEDGLESYIEKKLNLKSIVRLFLYKTILRIENVNYLGIGYSKNIKSYFTLNDKSFPWVTNRKLIKNLKIDFEKRQKKIRNTLVFISQPLVEDKILNKKNYIFLLKKIKFMSENYEEALFISHPRLNEDNFQYSKKYLTEKNLKWQFIKNNRIIEEEILSCNSKPKIVVSLSSTALININLITDIDVRFLRIKNFSKNKKIKKMQLVIKKLGIQSV